PATGHAAVKIIGIHHTGAREVRGGRARRRGAGAGDLGQYQAVRARHRRTLPRPDAGDVTVGNPPAGKVEDGGDYLETSTHKLATEYRPRRTDECPLSGAKRTSASALSIAYSGRPALRMPSKYLAFALSL